MAEDSTNQMDDLVNFTEAATILGVSRPTIYNLVAREKLTPIDIAHNRYLNREEVEQLKSSQAADVPAA